VSPSERTRAPRVGQTPARRPQTSAAAKRALRRGPAYQQSRLVLLKRNYLLMAAGAVAIVLGFFLLSNKEISVAPALLVLGYCVLIPAALLWEHVPGKPGPGRPGPGGEGE